MLSFCFILVYLLNSMASCRGPVFPECILFDCINCRHDSVPYSIVWWHFWGAATSNNLLFNKVYIKSDDLNTLHRHKQQGFFVVVIVVGFVLFFCKSLVKTNCIIRQHAYFLPSASRGLQCPDEAQGFGEDELEAYCRNTRPSVHLSHKDPTSLGNQ